MNCFGSRVMNTAERFSAMVGIGRYLGLPTHVLVVAMKELAGIHAHLGGPRVLLESHDPFGDHVFEFRLRGRSTVRREPPRRPPEDPRPELLDRATLHFRLGSGRLSHF